MSRCAITDKEVNRTLTGEHLMYAKFVRSLFQMFNQDGPLGVVAKITW